MPQWCQIKHRPVSQTVSDIKPNSVLLLAVFAKLMKNNKGENPHKSQYVPVFMPKMT